MKYLLWAYMIKREVCGEGLVESSGFKGRKSQVKSSCLVTNVSWKQMSVSSISKKMYAFIRVFMNILIKVLALKFTSSHINIIRAFILW